MNERMRNLSEQASKWVCENEPSALDDTDLFYELMQAKFAELIVRECMRMCDVAAVGYETHGHTKEANGCYSAKEYIEEHFGVEE
jgi:hypothetical protein